MNESLEHIGSETELVAETNIMSRPGSTDSSSMSLHVEIEGVRVGDGLIDD